MVRSLGRLSTHQIDAKDSYHSILAFRRPTGAGPHPRRHLWGAARFSMVLSGTLVRYLVLDGWLERIDQVGCGAGHLGDDIRQPFGTVEHGDIAAS